MSPTSRPGRPRQAEVDVKLQAAVLSLLRAHGPRAVTMEAVAAESGVAKTTIYRRYADRRELVRSVLTSAFEAPGPVPDGSVREKVRFALERAWRQMEDILGPGGLAALVVNDDPEFSTLFRETLRPYDQALVAEIREDAEAGLLRADVDADGVVSLFLGAYLGEIVRRGKVGKSWMDRSLDLIWPVLAPPAD
jgi:AcrR family transcriptional regulator